MHLNGLCSSGALIGYRHPKTNSTCSFKHVISHTFWYTTHLKDSTYLDYEMTKIVMSLYILKYKTFRISLNNNQKKEYVGFVDLLAAETSKKNVY